MSSKHVELFRSLQNIYSHFESYLGFGLAQVGEINSRTTIHVVCSTRQYHSCWCPGDFRSQGISRHGIGPQSQNIPSPAPEEFTNAGMCGTRQGGFSKFICKGVCVLYWWTPPQISWAISYIASHWLCYQPIRTHIRNCFSDFCVLIPLSNKDFLIWLLIRWQPIRSQISSYQPIRSHVRKCLSSNVSFLFFPGCTKA